VEAERRRGGTTLTRRPATHNRTSDSRARPKRLRRGMSGASAHIPSRRISRGCLAFIPRRRAMTLSPSSFGQRREPHSQHYQKCGKRRQRFCRNVTSLAPHTCLFLLPSLEGIPRVQALPLRQRRILRPQTRRALAAEYLRHCPAHWPRPGPVRHRVQATHSPRPRPDRVCNRAVNMFSPRPQPRPHSILVLDRIQAANCPRPAPVLKLSVTSPHPR
jgi:hypothetical protein